eukprot:jgi/Tetstr1/423354/TSEL_014048.t1
MATACGSCDCARGAGPPRSESEAPPGLELRRAGARGESDVDQPGRCWAACRESSAGEAVLRERQPLVASAHDGSVACSWCTNRPAGNEMRNIIHLGDLGYLWAMGLVALCVSTWADMWRLVCMRATLNVGGWMGQFLAETQRQAEACLTSGHLSAEDRAELEEDARVVLAGASGFVTLAVLWPPALQELDALPELPLRVAVLLSPLPMLAGASGFVTLAVLWPPALQELDALPELPLRVAVLLSPLPMLAGASSFVTLAVLWPPALQELGALPEPPLRVAVLLSPLPMVRGPPAPWTLRAVYSMPLPATPCLM